MKRLFLLLLVMLAASVWVADLAMQDPGYLLLSYKNTTVETSLWIGLLLLFIFVALVYLLVRVAIAILGGRRSIQRWSEEYRYRRGIKKTRQGTVDLLEGKWSDAQKKLALAASRSDTPLLNYIAAARAAAENGDDTASDSLLRKALEAEPSAELAVSLARAEIQIQRGQYEPALASLLDMRRANQRHKHLHKLLQQVYLELEDWQALGELMPILRKLKVSPVAELDEIEQKTVLVLIDKLSNEQSDKRAPGVRANRVREVWMKTPLKVRSIARLTSSYVDCMIDLDEVAWAEQALRESIQASWNEELVERYGLILGDAPDRQLLTAENWLKQRNNSAVLMLTLGRLCMHNKLWGKAREYFIGSVKLKKTPEAYAELARLLEHLGDKESGLEYMNEGFAMLAQNLPELPMPDEGQVNMAHIG